MESIWKYDSMKTKNIRCIKCETGNIKIDLELINEGVKQVIYKCDKCSYLVSDFDELISASFLNGEIRESEESFCDCGYRYTLDVAMCSICGKSFEYF